MSKQDELEEIVEIDENGSDPNDSEQNSSADNLRILEALLFASDELLTATRLKSILPGNPDGKQIRKMVDKINVQLQKERHPFEIVEIGGGYQFRTVSFYHTWVRQIFKEKASKKLSVQALECLAIIAYKQPLSKAEIEAIRGVVSDGAMKTLLEKRLVVISGRSEKPGRPLLYATSSEFLKYFGLNKLSDLPRIEEFEAIAREKMEELSIEELQKDEENPQEEEFTESQAEDKSSEENHTDGGQEPAAQEPGPQGSDEVSDAESTAVFEISIDEDDKEVFSDEQEAPCDESIDETVQDFSIETLSEDDSVEESHKSDSTEESSITGSTKESSITGSTEKAQSDETFDLEIAFEAEDIDEVLPSMQQNEKSPAKEDIKKEQDLDVPTGQAEEEVLEIFLPEDEVGSDQSDDNQKK